MSILKNLQISNYYKYLLYLAGLLLILSFSIDIKIISNLKLLIASLITLVYGVSCWIYEGNTKIYADNLNVEWQFASLEGGDTEKKFREKYNAVELSKKHGRTRIIMFISYIIFLTIGMIV